jgi:urease accessory protein
MTTTITTTTIITMIEGLGLARLLAIASPAFPTGGFAYSHGLDWAVTAGPVRDRAALQAWIEGVLLHGGGRSDAILLRHAHRGSAAPARLSELAELAAAAAPSAERRLETLAQGAALSQAARAWGMQVPEAAYPVAFGVLASALGIDEEATCVGYLSAFAGNLVSAGARLVPLGQSDALRMTACLHPLLLDIAEQTRLLTLDDLGGACFLADISSMLHETQYSRMFRT